MVGTTLGHYQILRLVGKGGMGEVYAAEDLTLGRIVAVKVLPAGLGAQPAELERLAREAKTIAALNHRAIVTLHSFEESGGVHFITMELVEGEPLSSRLPAGGLPFDELLRLGIEMTDAVGAAHERGIVHRDLKPANVLVRPDGQLKILDFGLAKLWESEAAASDLPTQQLTGEGRIVGTVAYMSPEQAEGRPVDHRSDIFSLGVMLYELSTGRRPFQGDTSISVLSAVLKDQPRSANELNPSVPAAFARVLKTCLQKDPERRYQSAKDLRNELRTLKEELDSGELTRPAPAARAASSRVPWPLVAAGLAVAALAVAAAVFWPRGSSRQAAPLVAQHTQLTSTSGAEFQPSLSPDGKWFVFASEAAGNADVYLQSVGGQTALNLTSESPAAEGQAAFSFDGERIAFRSQRDGGGLFVMGRTGEAPRRVTTEGVDPSWSPDGRRLAYATVSTRAPTSRGALSALRVVDIETGAVTELLRADAMNPAWSPNGRFIAYWGMTSGSEDFARARDIWAIPADGGAPWRVTDDAHVDWCPVWSPDGAYLYFASDRGGSMNLWRLPMDPDSGRPEGDPEPVTTPAAYVGRPQIAAVSGEIVFEAINSTSNVYRSPFDPASGALGSIAPVTSGSRAFIFIDPSPDGQFLVLGTGYLAQEDLFISRADGSGLRQLMADASYDRWPEWSPDGERIAFYSNRSGKYEIWTTTATGELRQITDAPDYSAIYPRWSPDGRRMTFSDISNRRAVVLFDPNRPWAEQTPEVLPAPGGAGSYLAGVLVWSPDSSRLAGLVGGVLTIYEIATRQYRPVGDVRGPLYAWLADGRLLVGPPSAPRLVDPETGDARAVAAPRFGALEPTFYRLSRNGRTAYFTLASTETDVWMVSVGAK
jgi:Tol biopolymer transport system component